MKTRVVIITIVSLIALTSHGGLCKGLVELLDTQFKVLKQDGNNVQFGWAVKVKNNTHSDFSLRIQLHYLDKDGLKVDESIVIVDLGRGETKYFSDACPTWTKEVFEKIRSYEVKVEPIK